MNTIIVTGGCGFIGSHICEKLLKLGNKVICFDNLSNCSTTNISTFKSDNNFTFVDIDVTKLSDTKEYDIYFKDTDFIMHQACSKCTMCLENPKRDLEVNAWGTFCMLSKAVEFGIKKFIHASTGSVYGEPVDFPSTEKHQLKPCSFYGVSKLAGERYTEVFGNMYGLEYSILRYFHVYGTRQTYNEYGGVVPIMINKTHHNEPIVIFGDGTQVRSFTSVEDISNINIFCMDNKDTDGKVFNCCSGIKVSINDLANKIQVYMKKEKLGIIYKDWKKGDIKNFEVSNEKLVKLGFKFNTNFDKVLAGVIDEYIIYFKSQYEKL